jgi:hypothetical protein
MHGPIGCLEFIPLKKITHTKQQKEATMKERLKLCRRQYKIYFLRVNIKITVFWGLKR